MFDIVTFGGATRDIFFKTTKGFIFPDPEDAEEKMLAFKYGQKIITDNATFAFGGGALNIAINMARLGLKIAISVNVGRDESAHSIIEKLRELFVDTSFITTDPLNHTALSLLVMDKKDHVAFLHRGANNFLKIPDLSKIKNAKWFYITSLTGYSALIMQDLVNFAHKNGIKVALNPGSTQLKNYADLVSLLPMVELLFLNREEAEELVCREEACDIVEDTEALLHKVKKLGSKSVVITEGEKGSFYIDDKEKNFQPAYTKDCVVVDTTGAGDAFGSTFLAARIRGKDIPTAQKMAAINASHVTEFIGAQDGLMTIKEIESKVKMAKKV